MATFKICVFEKHQKKDGRWPVVIRICWKRKYGYLKTEYYATIKQVNRKTYYDKQGQKKTLFSLKDPFVLNELNTRIAKYENLKATKLGQNIELYTAKDLVEYFRKEGAPGTDSSIDFIEFAGLHIKRLTDRGKKTTADTLRRTINSVIDFTGGRTSISITEINSKFLNQFESFLHGERTMKRINQFDRITTIKRKGLSGISIIDYMTDIRTIFNAAIQEYNDEDRDEIRIKHYPFRKYKLIKAPEPNKRDLSASQIKAIRDIPAEDLKLSRAILAREVFMLSFYLAGVNLADLYDMKADSYESGRLSYCRQKTRDRRRDRAYISIKVYPEALVLIERYRDKTGLRVFSFYQMYASARNFDSNINKGLKVVAKVCEIKRPLSSYFARFSFATIARNDCDISVDDIGMSLNHIPEKALKVTDGYIKKDWSLIDKALRKVLDFIK